MKNIISFSGGKDSTAMLLRMIELNYKIDKVIFADTTFEYPEMYIWINKIEKLLPCKLTRVTANHSFNSWFYNTFTRGAHKGERRGFPFVVSPCWWSRDSKVKPLTDAQGKGNVIHIGIAKDEEKRSKSKQYINQLNKFRFPLVEWGWTEQKCIDYLESRNLEHPLISKFKRTGCWLCPKQSLNSLENLYKYYPDLWIKLKQYEKDSIHGFKPNFSLEEFENKMNIKIKNNKSQVKLI